MLDSDRLQPMNASLDRLVPSEVLLDMQAVADGNRDPALLRRVEERSKLVQEQLLARHGVREIAVDLVREVRDEE